MWRNTLGDKKRLRSHPLRDRMPSLIMLSSLQNTAVHFSAAVRLPIQKGSTAAFTHLHPMILTPNPGQLLVLTPSIILVVCRPTSYKMKLCLVICNWCLIFGKVLQSNCKVVNPEEFNRRLYTSWSRSIIIASNHQHPHRPQAVIKYQQKKGN